MSHLALLERIAVTLDRKDHGCRDTCAFHQSDFSTPLCEVGQPLCKALYQPDAGGAVHVAALARGPQHQPWPSVPRVPADPSRSLTASRVALSASAAWRRSGERK